MNPEQIISELAERGIQVVADGASLRVNGRGKRLTEEERRALVTHKDVLLRTLLCRSETAGDRYGNLDRGWRSDEREATDVGHDTFERELDTDIGTQDSDQDSDSEDDTLPVYTLSMDGVFLCHGCWRKFPELELRIVDEPLGKGYRCPSCATIAAQLKAS